MKLLVVTLVASFFFCESASAVKQVLPACLRHALTGGYTPYHQAIEMGLSSKSTQRLLSSTNERIEMEQLTALHAWAAVNQPFFESLSQDLERKKAPEEYPGWLRMLRGLFRQSAFSDEDPVERSLSRTHFSEFDAHRVVLAEVLKDAIAHRGDGGSASEYLEAFQASAKRRLKALSEGFEAETQKRNKNADPREQASSGPEGVSQSSLGWRRQQAAAS